MTEFWLIDRQLVFDSDGDVGVEFEYDNNSVYFAVDALLSWLAEHDDKLAEAGSQYRVVRRG